MEVGVTIYFPNLVSESSPLRGGTSFFSRARRIFNLQNILRLKFFVLVASRPILFLSFILSGTISNRIYLILQNLIKKFNCLF